MKKIIKICSLLILFGLTLCMTSCVPSKEEAREKMLDKGYVTIDPNYLLTNNNSNAEKIFLFVKANTAAEAIANLLNIEQDKVLVYYFKTEAECKAFYEDYKAEQEYFLEQAKNEYEAGNMDKETYEDAVSNLKKQKMGRSGVCFYLGSKEAIKDFK